MKLRFNVMRIVYQNIMSNYFYDYQDENNNEVTKLSEGCYYSYCCEIQFLLHIFSI